MASRIGAVGGDSTLDIGRYELLSELDETLAERLQSASSELAAAEKVCSERASASVMAKRYREKIHGKVGEIDDEIELKLSARRQEDAVELWLESAKR